MKSPPSVSRLSLDPGRRHLQPFQVHQAHPGRGGVGLEALGRDHGGLQRL
jgi:hypothetical protein